MATHYASDVQIFLGDNPVPLRGLSVSYGMQPVGDDDGFDRARGEYTCECSFTIDGAAFNAIMSSFVPACFVPIRRISRSGRPLYGLHPSFGPGFWTDRPGDALERRRVRSRAAALVRSWTRRGEAVSS